MLDWEEQVEFNKDRKYDEDEEEDSIDHCKTSRSTDYKYNIFYEVGKKYTISDSNLLNLISENNYYAVSNIFKR